MAAAIIKTMTASSRARLVNPAIIAASPVVVSRVNRGESSVEGTDVVVCGSYYLSCEKRSLVDMVINRHFQLTICASESSHWQRAIVKFFH